MVDPASVKSLTRIQPDISQLVACHDVVRSSLRPPTNGWNNTHDDGKHLQNVVGGVKVCLQSALSAFTLSNKLPRKTEMAKR